MKVICSMVITPNGYIADLTGKSVSSQYNWNDFFTSAKKYNNFVIGRKTLELVGDGFKEIECKYPIVVSSHKELVKDISFFVAESPEDAIKLLEGKVETLFLVGGGEVNTAFARDGLINKLELTIEPQLLGDGKNIFASGDFGLKLECKNIEKLEGDRVRINYFVIK